MMRLCWNKQYGPMPINAEQKVWSIIHVPSGEDLAKTRKIFYVDDAVGEFWEFAEDDEGYVRQTESGDAVVEKHMLGQKMLKLVRRDAQP